MSHDITTDLVTMRDYWRYAISRFNAADDGYLNPIREMIADQKLGEARAKGGS